MTSTGISGSNVVSVPPHDCSSFASFNHCPHPSLALVLHKDSIPRVDEITKRAGLESWVAYQAWRDAGQYRGAHPHRETLPVLLMLAFARTPVHSQIFERDAPKTQGMRQCAPARVGLLIFHSLCWQRQPRERSRREECNGTLQPTS